jgi:IS30 family transposase
MCYQHITTVERIFIALYLELGLTITEISKQLERSKSTISREIIRNKVKDQYIAIKADKAYKKRRLKCRKPLRFEEEALMEFIQDRLKETWSPEQISGFLSIENEFPRIGYKTIYRYIKQNLLQKVSKENLRRKGRKGLKGDHKKGKWIGVKHISERPQEVDLREIAGHWELDTVYFYKGAGKYLATIVERKTRLLIARLIQHKTKECYAEAAIECLKKLPHELLKTITVDRGREFCCFKELEEALRVDVYLADANKPYQRGTNENTNGLIREFYPKNFFRGDITPEEIENMVNLINNRPRKCLGWKSPASVFEKLLHLD